MLRYYLSFLVMSLNDWQVLSNPTLIIQATTVITAATREFSRINGITHIWELKGKWTKKIFITCIEIYSHYFPQHNTRLCLFLKRMATWQLTNDINKIYIWDSRMEVVSATSSAVKINLPNSWIFCGLVYSICIITGLGQAIKYTGKNWEIDGKVTVQRTTVLCTFLLVILCIQETVSSIIDLQRKEN